MSEIHLHAHAQGHLGARGDDAALARLPEVLAPAGDADAMRAAALAGADAVYFGLVGSSARARAKNFDPADLPETMRWLHGTGRSRIRGAQHARCSTRSSRVWRARCARARTPPSTRVIVQDLGAAQLVRAIAPDMPIHASTQMTCTDAAAVALRARRWRPSRHPGARALARRHRRHSPRDRRRARSLRARRALRRLLGPVPHERGDRRAQRQPRRLRAGVPAALRARGRRRPPRPRRPRVSPLARGPRGERAGARSRAAGRRLPQDRRTPQGSRVRRRDDDPLPARRRRARRSPARPQRGGARDGPADVHARLGPRLSRGRRSPAPRRRPHLRPPRPPRRIVARRPDRGREAMRRAAHRGAASRAATACSSRAACRRGVGGRVWAHLRRRRRRGARRSRAATCSCGSGPTAASRTRTGRAARVWKTSDPAREKSALATVRHPHRVRLDVRVSGAIGERPVFEGTTSRGARIRVLGEAPVEAARTSATTAEALREKLGRLGETPFELGDPRGRLCRPTRCCPSPR